MDLKQVIGNEEAKDELLKWGLDWNRGKKGKPILLTGPIGIGKTIIINALAKEMNWNKIDVYKEDFSDEKKLTTLSIPGKTLWGEENFFVVEDADTNLGKRELTKLKKYFENLEHPLIITAVDLWETNLTEIRSLCIKLELKKINSRSMKSFLEKYAEEKNLPAELIPEIVEESNGDMRSAIIDLETGAAGSRERSEDIFKELLKVFKSNYDRAVDVSDSTDLDMLLGWVEENIPAEYEDPEEVAKAFEWFSRASIIKGRIYKRQYYTLMRYIKPVALGGVASAKKQKYAKFTRYAFPSIIRKYGQTKRNRDLLKKAALKIGRKTHSSSQTAKETAKLTGINEQAIKYYELDEDEAGLISPGVEVLKHKKATKSKNKS